MTIKNLIIIRRRLEKLLKLRRLGIIKTEGVVTSITLLPRIETVFLGVSGRFRAYHAKTLQRLEKIEARFADVFEDIEKYGLGCPRVQFRQLRGKLFGK